MAEFVAQEEMDRSTGYWWAPDDRHIAFARVDETPVEVTERFEIAADNVATFAQRYPAAGGPNVLDPPGGRRRIDAAPSRGSTWAPSSDIYVARVNWLPDGKTARDSAREPRSASAGSAVCGHPQRCEPRRPDRNQPQLDRAERRAVLSAQIPRVHLGVRARRLRASVFVRLRGPSAAPADRRPLECR